MNLLNRRSHSILQTLTIRVVTITASLKSLTIIWGGGKTNFNKTKNLTDFKQEDCSFSEVELCSEFRGLNSRAFSHYCICNILLKQNYTMYNSEKERRKKLFSFGPKAPKHF